MSKHVIAIRKLYGTEPCLFGTIRLDSEMQPWGKLPIVKLPDIKKVTNLNSKSTGYI